MKYLKSTNKITIRKMSFLSMYVAVFLVMTFVPQVGYIRIGLINATMMAIPVSLATIHFGWKGALFGLICFGISSLLGCLYFQPPIVAVGWGQLIVMFLFGRLLILGPIVGVTWVANLIRKKIKANNPRKLYTWKYIYALVLGLTISIFNTIFVGLIMFTLSKDTSTFAAFAALIATNIVIEWTVPPFISMSLATLGFYLEHREKAIKMDTY